MATTLKDMLGAAHAVVPMIAPADAAALVDSAGALIVDTRDGTEIAASGRAKGALAVPRGSRADPGPAAHIALLRNDRPIVLYCAGGSRAALAGKTLIDLRFTDVRNLGGFKDWVAAAARWRDSLRIGLGLRSAAGLVRNARRRDGRAA